MSEQLPLPVDFGFARLSQLDERVDAAEGEGLRARWEFGRELLHDGTNIAAYARSIGKPEKETEYKHRLRFARWAETEEDFVNAVNDFGSWHRIVNEALSSTAHLSSAKDEWATPQDLFDLLDAEFGFTLDVCATAANAKCADFFAEAALEQEWTGTCWMNPPYSEIEAWIEKAYKSAEAGATVVCLVPSRTDVGWTWEWARRGEVRFLRGRLHFTDDEGNTGPAPFPSAVLVFPREPRVLWWER